MEVCRKLSPTITSSLRVTQAQDPSPGGDDDHHSCHSLLRVRRLYIPPHHATTHHTTPHRATPHHTTPQHTTSHHTTPSHTTPHHTTTHHITPHHTTPHRATPHHTTLTTPHEPHHTTHTGVSKCTNTGGKITKACLAEQPK